MMSYLDVGVSRVVAPPLPAAALLLAVRVELRVAQDGQVPEEEGVAVGVAVGGAT